MMTMDEDRNDDELLAQAIAEYEQELVSEPDRSVPQSIEKDTQFKFMRELLSTKDSKKIGNLSPDELGHTNKSLRGALKVSLLAHTLGLEETHKYYKGLAEIIAATSMSKKATFLQLIFTQIKKTFTGTSSPSPEKRGLFGWGKKRQESGGMYGQPQ